MELPLVVGTDGSTHSLQALDWAADEAAMHGIPLRVVHSSLWERYERAVPSISGDERPPFEVLAEHIAASGAERARLRHPDLKVSSHILADEPEAALQHESHEAFAVVTGSRGRGGIAGALLGSVSLAVAARATCPVIVVRGVQKDWEDTSRPVVVGVSDVAEGGTAMDFAFREASVRRSPLRAVKAWRCPSYETVDHPLFGQDPAVVHEERASALLTDVLYGPQRVHENVEVQRRVTEGPTHRVLVDASEEAGLIVLGAPRRHGHVGLQLGRVTHAVLHHSACPVAVIPEPY